MANLKEVNLDNNIVIQVPEGKKIDFIQSIARLGGYKDMIPTREEKSEILEIEEVDDFLNNLPEFETHPRKQLISNEADDNYGKVLVIYYDTTPVENSKDILEFGMEYISNNFMNLVRNAKSSEVNGELNDLFEDLTVE